MEIKYEFVTGEVLAIEVEDELGEVILELDRQERNNDRRESRRHMSLDGMDFEGETFRAEADTPREAMGRVDTERLMEALDMLSLSQRELLLKVYFKGMRIVDIAREQGVGESAIRDRIRRIHKKLKKYLE
jgi:RNA polymerase sigma factor (sigma-70 family)